MSTQYDVEGIPQPPEPPTDEMVPYTPRPTRAPSVDELATRERNRRDALELVDREHADVMPTRLGRVKMRDVVAQMVEEVHAQNEHGVTGFPTGVPSFDKVAAPLFQPGHLIVAAAGTKTGKTAILNQWMAAWAAQNIPVILFSFEDDQMDTARRNVANLGNGNIGHIRSGFIDQNGNRMPIPAEFDEAAAKVADLDVDMVTTRANCVQIAFEVGSWKQSWPEGASTGVVVIDQLSHILPDDPAQFRSRFPHFPPPPPAYNEVKLLEWQADILARIAAKWGVLVVLTHQLNANKAEWEQPNERSLAGAKAIGHKAHALIIPWRPSRLPKENPLPGEAPHVENTDERMWLVCPIARVVPPFKVEVEWQGVHQRVAELGARIGEAPPAPKPVTAEQMEGMAARRKLRSRWDKYVSNVHKAANGADVEKPVAPVTRRSLGTVGAKWQLPAPKPRADHWNPDDPSPTF